MGSSQQGQVEGMAFDPVLVLWIHSTKSHLCFRVRLVYRISIDPIHVDKEKSTLLKYPNITHTL